HGYGPWTRGQLAELRIQRRLPRARRPRAWQGLVHSSSPEVRSITSVRLPLGVRVRLKPDKNDNVRRRARGLRSLNKGWMLCCRWQ
ncbi:hypothetical protein CSUI_009665, partial [Cystoisospora suis]